MLLSQAGIPVLRFGQVLGRDRESVAEVAVVQVFGVEEVFEDDGADFEARFLRVDGRHGRF